MTFYEFFHSVGFFQWIGIFLILLILGDIIDATIRNLKK
jgi:hypothetical protein